MDEFPANSHKLERAKKTEAGEKELKKVVSGTVTQRKQPLSKRFKEAFIGDDSGSVWGYVFLDVMIPAAKDMVSDAVSTGVERMLFGEHRSPTSRARRSGIPGHTPYNRFSTAPRPDPREAYSRRARATHDFNEIIIDSRAEAEQVIDNLYHVIETYEVATVADLYELVGIRANFTDDKWGWTDIRGAGVSRVRNGFLLDLPKPEPID
jgi:hypothetical protein